MAPENLAKFKFYSDSTTIQIILSNYSIAFVLVLDMIGPVIDN